MAKKSEVQIPEYLELAKGAMWFDINGANCSGIRLIKSDSFLTARSGKDLDADVVDIPLDDNNNKSFEHGAYGITKNKQDSSHFFKTTDIPNEKMRNILNAINEGILVAYDPKNPSSESADAIKKKNFEYNKDGDLVFIGKNKDVFKKLSTYTFLQLQDYIKMCGKESKNNLMDMYQYELQGYNPKNRPRFEVLEIIKLKLNDLGGGLSAITINED